MFVLMLNIILGAGAQGLSIPVAGFPLTIMDIFLFLGLFRMFSRAAHNKALLLRKDDAMITILALIALFRAVINIFTNGLSAIRDCTHYMDMLFVPVLYFELIEADTRIDLAAYLREWFIKTKDCVFFYSLLLPFRPILIRISPKGFGAQSAIPILGSFTITHLWLLVIVMVNSYIVSKGMVRGKRRNWYIIQSVISMVLMVYTSSRITMLTMLVFLLISMWHNQANIFYRIMKYVLIGALAMLVLAMLGITIETSRGTFSISNLFDMFLSIFGDESAGYDGASLRLGFFSTVIESHSSIDRVLFGGGFGYPLISFGAATGANVREPHCSYLSVYARNGVIFLSFWFSYLLGKLKLARNSMNNNTYGYILFVVLVSCLMNATCETFFETPCEASVFYGLVAICSYMIVFHEESGEAI